jgi:hypothetical protein
MPLTVLQKAVLSVLAIDPKVLKSAWIEMSDEAEAKMSNLANEKPEMPIGVAFVDNAGKPGWIGDYPGLKVHAPSVRGCWPVVRSTEPKEGQ